MKKLCLPKGRRRNTVTLLLALFLALLLLAGNLLLPYAFRRAGVYIDISPEGLYTVTDAMKKEVSELDTDVEILFFSDEDKLLNHELLRYVYIMSRKLSDESPRISLSTVDLTRDPTAADRFKTAQGTSIRSTDVVVHSAGRYKILSADSFFGTENNEYISFNGEYRLATAILSVTTYPNGPYAYFATGHGERYYVEGDAGSDPSLSAFAELLRDTGLRVGRLNLDEVEQVPDDCVLLLFVGTKNDYSVEDIYDYNSPSTLKKLDKYLFEKKSVMFFRDALADPLPDIEDYLAEWGIGFTPTHLTSPEASLTDSLTGEKNGDRLVASYPDKDYDAPGFELIKDIASLATPPKTVLAESMALKQTLASDPVYTSAITSRSVCPVFYADKDAKAKNEIGQTSFDPAGDRHILALVGMEATLEAGEHRYSYVFAAGSTKMISNEYLADTAFGNADVMASILRSISRTDVYASGDVGGFDLNSDMYGGKWFDDTHLSTEGKNTVYHSQTSWDEYAQMTPARIVAVAVGIFITPLVFVPLIGVAVLRRRKNR